MNVILKVASAIYGVFGGYFKKCQTFGWDHHISLDLIDVSFSRMAASDMKK